MFRVKVTVTLALIIIAATLAVYFVLPGELEKRALESAQHALDISATSLERSERLDDFSLVTKASGIAEFSGLKTALTDEYSGNYEYQRHLGVYNKGLLRWKFVFENLQKDKDNARNIDLPLEERRPFMPDIVFVTDERGNGVAALGKGKYDWYNVNVAKQQPTVLKAQLGATVKDAWVYKWNQSDNDDMYRIAIAPVTQGAEKLIGVVVVGNLVNDGAAQSASAAVGGNGVAYFHQGRIYASTLKSDEDEVLAKHLFEELKIQDEGIEPDALRVDIAGKQYLAAVRYHSPNASDATSGFIVLTSLDDELALPNQVRTWTLIMGLLMLLLTVGSVFAYLFFYTKAFEEIDRGVQEVIAGNKDYEFTVSGNYSMPRALARSLNQLSAVLQDKALPDEGEDEAAGDWGDLMVEDVSATSMMRAIHAEQLRDAGKPVVAGVALPGMPGPPPKKKDDTVPPATNTAPAKRDDKALYDEYLNAKKKLGEDVSDMDFDGFKKRLDKNRKALMKKHNAKDIQFNVLVRDGKVVLKPQPIL